MICASWIWRAAGRVRPKWIYSTQKFLHSVVIKMPINYCAIGFSEEDNLILQDAEKAIEKAGMWEYMKGEPGHGGYEYADDDELKEIYQYIRYDGHTGGSMKWAMLEMQKLARLGIDEYCAQASGMRVGPEIKEPVRQPRTPEMDKKVIEEYKNVKPFKRPPKWATEYATLYPQIIANLKFE